jgi:alkylation response protein AidB-like acyl-CoA dehydrogenase
MSQDGQGYMTEERRIIRDAARDFTMREVLPVANRLDGPDGEIPMELRQKLADMGYFGITIDEKYGGLGLGAFEYCLICEQLARGWMSVASLVARAQGGWIKSSMPEEMRANFLPRVVRGEFLNASALSEPTPDRTWLRSLAAPCSRATSGCSPATSTGAPSPTAPTI